MARNYVSTILFLYCTSVLITLVVSDPSSNSTGPPPSPPTSSNSTDPPPPPPTSSNSTDPPPSPPTSSNSTGPPPSPPISTPLTSPPTWAPPLPPPNAPPPLLPPTSTPPALAPTSTPPALSPMLLPPTPASTWAPAPAPVSTPTPAPTPAPTSTYPPPPPTSTYPPPSSTSTYPPPPPQKSTYPPPPPTSTYPPPQSASTYPPPPQSASTNPPPPQSTSTYEPPQATLTYPPPQSTSTFEPPQSTSTYPSPQSTSTYPPLPPTSTFPPSPPTSTYPPEQGDGPSASQLLKVHFYATTCPQAEELVMEEMKLIQAEDRTLMPALLRLHFHDCFVRGCDASVLLVSKNGTAEKDAKPNLSLRGFSAIERLKTKLEKACPSIVSCADILAMAAREAVFLSNGSRYDVETGRLDGNISIAKEAYYNLPPATGNISALMDLYTSKNLTVKDLVVLSGAHTIGVSHCSSFSDRLFNYSGTGYVDPSLNSTYAQQLKQRCVPDDNTTVVSLSPNNYFTFNLGYFKAVINKQGLLNADEALLHNGTTLAYVTAQANANSTAQFFADFALSMLHMGRIGVRTGTNGTIRAVCGSYVD